MNDGWPGNSMRTTHTRTTRADSPPFGPVEEIVVKERPLNRGSWLVEKTQCG
jgi:hypothetical protein